MTIPVPKVGDKMKFWGSGREDGTSRVLKVSPYTGLYKKWFSHTIRLSAENTRRGWAEICWGDDIENKDIHAYD